MQRIVVSVMLVLESASIATLDEPSRRGFEYID
jgi:hypothetical protein